MNVIFVSESKARIEIKNPGKVFTSPEFLAFSRICYLLNGFTSR